MDRKKAWYYAVNLAVLLLTATLFVVQFRDVKSVFVSRDIRHIALITLVVAIVHLVKATRLYMILLGSGIRVQTFAAIYCRVTPVSVLLPFKLGEFYRMYCYGTYLGSLIRGVIIVILDRFMDTMALITIILLVCVFNGGRVSALAYAMLLFLVCVLLLYLIYPGVHRYWKRSVLRARASERRLAFLRMLKSVNELYEEITTVSRGRGALLYFLSLVAWAVEIGSLVLLHGISNDGNLNQTVSDYLASAMGGGTSIELRQFIFISIALMATLYVCIKVYAMIQSKTESLPSDGGGSSPAETTPSRFS